MYNPFGGVILPDICKAVHVRLMFTILVYRSGRTFGELTIALARSCSACSVLSSWDAVEPERSKSLMLEGRRGRYCSLFSAPFSSSGTGILFNHSVEIG